MALVGNTGMMRQRRSALRAAEAVLLGSLLLGLLAAPVFAQGPVEVDLMVSLISEAPGKVDPRARALDEKLRARIRYESIEVLQTKHLSLGLDDVGTVKLPGGRLIHVKPLLVDDRGALLAVDWEGQIDTQLRVKSEHLVVLGPQRYDGKSQLVVSLVPRF